MLGFQIEKKKTINTGRARRKRNKNIECSPKRNLMKLMNILLDYPSDALHRGQEIRV
jgi:hypothetical protein